MSVKRRPRSTNTLVSTQNQYRGWHARGPRARLPDALLRQIGHLRGDDHRRFTEFLDKNFSLSGHAFGHAFPKHVEQLRKPIAFEVEHPSLYANVQIHRINNFRGKLSSALRDLGQISQLQLGGNGPQADQAIDQFIAEYGFSCTILRKKFLNTLINQKDGDVAFALYNRLKKESPTGFAGIYAFYLFERVDPTTSPAERIELWNKIAPFHNCGTFERLLVLDNDFSSINLFENSDIISSYAQASLIDGVISVWRLSALAHCSKDRGAPIPLEDLAPEIQSTLKQHFTNIEKQTIIDHFYARNQLMDEQCLRLAFFLDEYSDICRWRYDVESRLRLARERSFESPSGQPALSCIELYRTLTECDEIETDEDPESIHFVELVSTLNAKMTRHVLFPKKEQGPKDFINALCFGEYVWHDAKAKSIVDNRLLEFTVTHLSLRDVASSTIVEKLRHSLPLDLENLANIVFLTLQLLQEDNDDLDMERRWYFMDWVLSHGDSDIVYALNTLEAQAPRTARTLAVICSRTFVERLFRIVRTFADVIRIRIDIIQWLLAKEPERTSYLRKELASLLNLQISLGKQAAWDKARVFVDEEQLLAWIIERHERDLLRVVRSAKLARQFQADGTYDGLEVSAVGAGSDVEATSRLGDAIYLVRFIPIVFEQFLRHPVFGLDAYLSRRVRHGPLRGEILSRYEHGSERALFEVERKGARQAELAEIGMFLVEAKAGIEGVVDRFRRDRLQLNGKDHPKGLISDEWKRPEVDPYFVALINEIRRLALADDGSDLVARALVTFCWRVADFDLASTATYLQTNFLRELFDEFDRHLALQSSLTRQRKSELHRIIHTELIGAVEFVCTWFQRSDASREIFELKQLTDIHYSIVDRYFPASKIEFLNGVDDEIVVEKGLFHILGDCLHIVIENAFKHGPENGRLEIHARITHKTAGSDKLTLTAVSDLHPTAETTTVARRLSTALEVSEEAASHAAFTEGFTGFRKMLSLVRTVGTSGNVDAIVVGEARRVEVCVDVPISTVEKK